MIVGRHYQNAHVTRNIVQAVAEFQQRADIRLLLETEISVTLWTPQGEGTGTQKLAFLRIGDMQVELIQPGQGDVLALYRDALPADDRLCFPHVCHRVDDWDAFLAQVYRQDYPVVLKGGTPGLLQFLYLDIRAWLDHYSERVWMVPERSAAMGGRRMTNMARFDARDLDRAKSFYDELAALLGAVLAFDRPDVVAYKTSDSGMLLIGKPFEGEASPGNGNQVGIQADSRATVNAIHARALALGGQCKGKFGIRGDDPNGFYGAYFSDLDGNKLIIFRYGPPDA